MAEEAPETNPQPESEGVFGNLPGTRPGSRSPRRGNAARESAATPDGGESLAAPPPPPPPPPADPPPPTEREAPVTGTPDAGRQRIASVEDLAWAGVAVAAQAATVGIRLASRALEAARKSADRG